MHSHRHGYRHTLTEKQTHIDVFVQTQTQRHRYRHGQWQRLRHTNTDRDIEVLSTHMHIQTCTDRDTDKRRHTDIHRHAFFWGLPQVVLAEGVREDMDCRMILSRICIIIIIIIIHSKGSNGSIFLGGECELDSTGGMISHSGHKYAHQQSQLLQTKKHSSQTPTWWFRKPNQKVTHTHTHKHTKHERTIHPESPGSTHRAFACVWDRARRQESCRGEL